MLLLNITVKYEIFFCIQLSVSVGSELKHACKQLLAYQTAGPGFKCFWRSVALEFFKRNSSSVHRLRPSPRDSLTAFFDYCVSWNKSISSLCLQPKQSGASTLCCSLDDHRGLNRLDILLLARAANSSVFKLPATNQLTLHTLKATILTGSKTSLSYELGLKGRFN